MTTTIYLLLAFALGASWGAFLRTRACRHLRAELAAALLVVDRATALIETAEARAHLTPLIRAQADRMQDAQDETDAHHARHGWPR